MTLWLPRYEAKCVQRVCFQCEWVPWHSDIKGTELPPPIYWYHSKGSWLRYNFAAESFYIMKLCSRVFVLYCQNCPKDDKFRYFIPILRKLGAAYNLGWWLLGKPVSSVVLSAIELLFLSLAVEALQGKICQNSLPSGGGRSLGAKISGGRGCPAANILIPLERQLIALQLCCWEFLYNETLQQTFRPLLSKSVSYTHLTLPTILRV